MTTQFVSCPNCGWNSSIKRLGNVGVPESRYGSGERKPDSRRFKCMDCGETFRSSGVTMWEWMGRDPREDVPY